MVQKYLPEITVSSGALISAAAALLLLPLRWAFALFLAGFVHELSHILTIMMQNNLIYSIEVRTSGAKIVTAPMTSSQERIAACAGPVGSVLLCSLWRLYPELTLCGICQGLFNLLPVYPFDGGRILHSFVEEFASSYVQSFDFWLRWLSAVSLAATAILLSVLFPRWIPLLLISCVMILYRAFRKIPCKESILAVQ